LLFLFGAQACELRLALALQALFLFLALTLFLRTPARIFLGAPAWPLPGAALGLGERQDQVEPVRAAVVTDSWSCPHDTR